MFTYQVGDGAPEGAEANLPGELHCFPAILHQLVEIFAASLAPGEEEVFVFRLVRKFRLYGEPSPKPTVLLLGEIHGRCTKLLFGVLEEHPDIKQVVFQRVRRGMELDLEYLEDPAV